MNTSKYFTKWTGSGVGLMAAGLFSAPAFAQQASLSLGGGACQAVQYNNTEWSLTKQAAESAIPSGGTASWVVAVTKGDTSANHLVCDGYLSILNSGSAPATIGNIVVNLQRKVGPHWVTFASDIANATYGDAATSAIISPTASSEGRGSFSENAGSGTLEFFNASDNTIFSVSPQQTIAAGNQVNLYYSARYNNSFLAIPDGALVRFEVIVTFGNSGGRGNSGASSQNLDINGNGVIDADEAHVRSVPHRVTRAVPAAVAANSQVTLTDPEVVAGGTATVLDLDLSSIGSGLTLTESGSFTVTATADAGESGGTVTNTAFLQGEDLIHSLLVGTTVVTNPDGTTSIVNVYYDFVTQAGVSLAAESTVAVLNDPEVPPVGQADVLNVGDFYSFTQGGWGSTPHGNNPGMLLHNNFSAVFGTGGVEVGIAGTAGYSMKFTSAAAVRAFLPAGRTAGALTADLVDPTRSSAGVFGGQVLALKLNVAFSAAHVTPSGYGDLVLVDTGTALDGMTVGQVLVEAEIALGGGTAAADIATLNTIATNLNEAVDNGTVVTLWAQTHLSR